MYNNPYLSYNSQINIDRIDKQIADLERMKSQIQQPMQPTNLTQNFQISPNREMMKFVDSIDDVNKEPVYGTTPFFSKDMSILWVKSAQNNVKAYELKEIVSKDEKDIKIALLEEEIKKLKEGKNEPSNNTGNTSATESSLSTTVQSTRNDEK